MSAVLALVVLLIVLAPIGIPATITGFHAIADVRRNRTRRAADSAV